LLKPPHVPAELVNDAADAGADRVRRLVAHVHRLLADAGEAGRVAAVRERIRGDILDRRAGERVVRDVHVDLLVLRRGPDDAELVLQVEPRTAVTHIAFDSALEALGPVGADVARVQHRLARLREPLHGVHDRNRVRDAEVLEQLRVRGLVDPGLESAEVDRHAIRDLVVDGLQYALTGCHRFLLWHSVLPCRGETVFPSRSSTGIVRFQLVQQPPDFAAQHVDLAFDYVPYRHGAELVVAVYEDVSELE